MILDTNAVSAILAGDESIRPVLEAVRSLVIPAVVVGEYRYGMALSRKQSELASAFDQLLRRVTFAPVDDPVTRRYAQVRQALRNAGTPIPENDVWVSATAVQYQLPVLSRDAHFDVVPGVKRVGW